VSAPEEPGGTRPAVYARLAEHEDVRAGGYTPHPAARWFGWFLCVALVAGVVAAAVRVHPW
jgi:hypothetical protein